MNNWTNVFLTFPSFFFLFHPPIQSHSNRPYYHQVQTQVSHHKHSPLKSHANSYHGIHQNQTRYSGHNNGNNKLHNQQHQNQSSSHGTGNNSNTSKLPHGLTVQELKEMTRARLAAEAAEGKDQEKDIRLVTSTSSDTSASAPIDLRPQLHYNQLQQSYSHEMGGNSGVITGPGPAFNRQRILSADSFGSVERQRLGSVESFGSTRSAYAASGYHQTLLRQTLSHDALEQPSVGSFSYDAQDNESYVSAIGSESFFGSEAHTVTSNNQNVNNNICNSNATPKHSGSSSSIYTLPYSSNSQLSPMSHANRKVTHNIHHDGWNADMPIPRTSSPSPASIPKIPHSTGSRFGGGGATENNQRGSSFFTSLPIGKFERAISAGGVVPNSVAESVLGPSSEENNARGKSNIFQNYNPQNNLVSPQPTTNDRNSGRSMPFSFPWSFSKQKQSEDNSGDLNISQLQNEWNSTYLDVDAKDKVDDFPLSTFTSKASSTSSSNYVGPDLSPSNGMFVSSFQTVPEEQVIHNLASLDVNVPESFHDDNLQELSVPKFGNKLRRKKSQN